MMEFLHGHWESIFNRTCMTRDCFILFFSIIEQTGRLIPSRAVSVEEQLMIFFFSLAMELATVMRKRHGNIRGQPFLNTLDLCWKQFIICPVSTYELQTRIMSTIQSDTTIGFILTFR